MGTVRRYLASVGVFSRAGFKIQIPTARSGLLCALLGGVLLLTGCGRWRLSLRRHQHALADDHHHTGGRDATSVIEGEGSCGLAGLSPQRTAEDRSVIHQFATHGASIFTPNATTALKRASRHLAREAAAVHAAVPSLSREITAEAQILAKAGHLVSIRADQAALMTALRRRRTGAASAGVPNCAGTHVSTS